MQPRMAAAIEKATRKQFPEGIAAHGTDALRFTFAALATQSRDIRFDQGRVMGYRHFCNKLWNAARFVLISIGEPATVNTSAAANDGPLQLTVTDRWIRSRLGHAIAAFDAAVAEYRFDYAATALYDFTWYEFCDWYLELVKPVLRGEGFPAAAQQAARRTLLDVLETLLRALHPLMPFITEEIWQQVAKLAGREGATIMLAPWPKASDFAADPGAETELKWIMQCVLGVRQIRGEMEISPAKKLPLLLQRVSAADRALIDKHGAFLARLAGLESTQVLSADDVAPPAASALVGDLTLLVPMAGLIEPAGEIARLGKRLQKSQAELAKTRLKLSNDNFVKSAPEAVVLQERARQSSFELEVAGIERQLAQVRALL
jgi:valyl-tRNA synthetase